MHWRFAVGLIAAGIALVVVAGDESTLQVGSSAEPQEITAYELAEHGPGDNRNIRLTEFRMTETDFVYVGKDDRWEKVYVPLYAREGTYAHDVRILLKSRKVANMAALEALDGVRELQGMVMNGVEKLGGEERRLLRESYPRVKLSDAWILEHDRQTSGAKVLAMSLVGIALVLGGVCLVVKPHLARRADQVG